MTPRYLASSVSGDLADRMVFVGGPRQVGKTTFGLSLLGPAADESSPAYLNWDHPLDREAILSARLPARERLVIFDEIHKYAGWRGLIKGLYDKHRSSISFLVTGSARLDYYRKGGDSLQGRYHYYRLHPFTLLESPAAADADTVGHLLRFGGFPEPFLRGEERFHRRWLREHSTRVVYEDLRDLEQVREVSRLDLLLAHLPGCVGSPLSVNHLRKLLQASHESVERWISAFERLYLCYRLAPFGSAPIRAVRKERKLYFWDWSRVDESGARFENMVAGHLLKYCHLVEDTQGHAMELRFLRDTDGREIDFVVLRDGRPEFAVECKSGERRASPACRYMRERSSIPRWYQVHLGTADYGDEHSATRVLPFATFCRELSLP
ncbi:MAG: ATP-binding protein [Spirochaetaceae bacterium]|nr:ATP-binding protein [Spirochaetaceae bacterium]